MTLADTRAGQLDRASRKASDQRSKLVLDQTLVLFLLGHRALHRHEINEAVRNSKRPSKSMALSTLVPDAQASPMSTHPPS